MALNAWRLLKRHTKNGSPKPSYSHGRMWHVPLVLMEKDREPESPVEKVSIQADMALTGVFTMHLVPLTRIRKWIHYAQG